MTIHQSAVLVRSSAATRAPVSAAGGWLSAPLKRQRKLSPFGGLVAIGGRSVPTEDVAIAWLTPAERWTIYRRVPDVRASIDSIVRTVATWDWSVTPTIDPADPRYKEVSTLAEGAQRFLAAPNADGETWQELLTKMLTDVLVHDQGAIEKVWKRDRSRGLAELVAVKGPTIIENRDDHGRLKDYEQNVKHADPRLDSGSESVPPDDLLVLRLFPTTHRTSGNPLIETILTEAITLILAAEHVRVAYDADEVAPGIVVLAGLAGPAAERARADLQNLRGKDERVRVITTPDPKAVGARWVELRHTPKDLAMREIIAEFRRTVWRVFGVMPILMGDTDKMPRATAQAQLDASNSHLITPILELIEAKLNTDILPALLGDDAGLAAFGFNREKQLSQEDKARQADRLDKLVARGVISRNEARAELGMDPVEGGDVLTIQANDQPMSWIQPEQDPAPDTPGSGEEDPEPEPAPGEAEPANADEDATERAGISNRACCETGEGHLDCVLRRVPQLLSAGDLSKREAVLIAFDECLAPCSERADPGEEPSRVCVHSIPRAEASSPKSSHDRMILVAYEAERQVRRSWDAPAEWADLNSDSTLDLGALAGLIRQYAADVTSEWNRSRAQATADAAAVISNGITADEATALASRIDSETARLGTAWATAAAGHYRDAGKLARDLAVKLPGIASAGDDHERRADLYASRAMGFLAEQGGPPATVRRLCRAAIRRHSGRSAGEDLVREVGEAFDVQEYRIHNWSGKLIDLAHQIAVRALIQAEESEGISPLWLVRWNVVGDGQTCAVCSEEGGHDLRTLGEIRIYPGGATDCRGNCRCVLSFHLPGG